MGTCKICGREVSKNSDIGPKCYMKFMNNNQEVVDQQSVDYKKASEFFKKHDDVIKKINIEVAPPNLVNYLQQSDTLLYNMMALKYEGKVFESMVDPDKMFDFIFNSKYVPEFFIKQRPNLKLLSYVPYCDYSEYMESYDENFQDLGSLVCINENSKNPDNVGMIISLAIDNNLKSVFCTHMSLLCKSKDGHLFAASVITESGEEANKYMSVISEDKINAVNIVDHEFYSKILEMSEKKGYIEINNNADSPKIMLKALINSTFDDAFKKGKVSQEDGETVMRQATAFIQKFAYEKRMTRAQFKEIAKEAPVCNLYTNEMILFLSNLFDE